MNVDKLVAGKTTDRLVAALVLGIDPAHRIDAYSTDYEAALDLLDRLKDHKAIGEIIEAIKDKTLKKADVPLAVCKAALKSVKE